MTECTNLEDSLPIWRSHYTNCLDACGNAPLNGDRDAIHAWGQCIEDCRRFEHRINAVEDCKTICEQEYAVCNRSQFICLDDPDRSNLRTVRISNWSRYLDTRIRNPHQTVRICASHFPDVSLAGKEIDAAFELINNVQGTDINLLPVRTSPHLYKPGLFPSDPVTAISYIDTLDDAYHGCKPDKVPTCSKEDNPHGFSGNCCRYDGDLGWGPSGEFCDKFVISLNESCYRHYRDRTNSGFPKRKLYMHEVGHALGMTHVDQWPPTNRGFATVMGNQNSTFFTAFDVAYLRHHYPKDHEDFQQPNFVASSQVFYEENAELLMDDISRRNPTKFYQGPDGFIRDCETHRDPYFRFAWFNTGMSDQKAGHCLVNGVYISQEDGSQERLVYEWKAASMPSLSQDRWEGTIKIPNAVLNNLSNFGSLTFKTNIRRRSGEFSIADNEVSYRIRKTPVKRCLIH